MNKKGKIKLEISPELIGMLNKSVADWVVVDKEIGENAKIRDVFVDLALTYPDFRMIVFDLDMGTVNDRVMISINNELVQLVDVTEAEINNGDIVIITPVYADG